jgi:hypothetical protein
VVRERVAWLIEGLEDGSVVGLDRYSFGGERAASVGRAEWTVRHSLLVQALRDDDLVQDSRLALDPPERAALDKVRGDAGELVPPFQSTVGFDHGVERIIHD